MHRTILITLFALFIFAFAVACSPATAPATVAPTVLSQASSGQAPSPASNTMTKVDLKSNGVFYTFQVVPDQSEAGYAVRELFFGQPAAQTTIGSTKLVEGQFVAGLQSGKLVLQSNTFKVDLRTLKSDNPLRDQAIQRQWLESSKYPFAEFTSTSIEGVPTDLKEGQPISFKIKGDMKIRDITKPLTFDAQVTLTNSDTLTGSGTTFLLMKDFGFSAPDIAGRLSVTDGVTVTVKGTAKLTGTK